MKPETALNESPNEKCERCGDLLYHPKVMIESERQRAAEWEEIATSHCKTINKLEADLERHKNLLREQCNRSQDLEAKLKIAVEALESIERDGEESAYERDKNSRWAALSALKKIRGEG